MCSHMCTLEGREREDVCKFGAEIVDGDVREADDCSEPFCARVCVEDCEEGSVTLGAYVRLVPR